MLLKIYRKYYTHYTKVCRGLWIGKIIVLYRGSSIRKIDIAIYCQSVLLVRDWKGVIY